MLFAGECRPKIFQYDLGTKKLTAASRLSDNVETMSM